MTGGPLARLLPEWVRGHASHRSIPEEGVRLEAVCRFLNSIGTEGGAEASGGLRHGQDDDTINLN